MYDGTKYGWLEGRQVRSYFFISTFTSRLIIDCSYVILTHISRKSHIAFSSHFCNFLFC